MQGDSGVLSAAHPAMLATSAKATDGRAASRWFVAVGIFTVLPPVRPLPKPVPPIVR